MTFKDANGAVKGKLRWVLQAEGAALLLAATLAYAHFGSGWGHFALFFLLPDVALLAYFLGPRWGALAYNGAHSTLGAWLLLLAGLFSGGRLWLSAGLIWLAHIGFDRMLGYGLKYASGFRNTHLGLIGREKPNAR